MIHSEAAIALFFLVITGLPFVACVSGTQQAMSDMLHAAAKKTGWHVQEMAFDPARYQMMPAGDTLVYTHVLQNNLPAIHAFLSQQLPDHVRI